MKKYSGRSAIHGTWVLILTLVLPFGARAANEGEIHDCIISINRMYESLDYERALSQLQIGRQLPRGMNEDVTLWLYEGIILCEMGKQNEGRSAFRAALLLKPDATLPVQTVAPKVLVHFESVRKQVKQEMDRQAPSPKKQEPPKETLDKSGCQASVRIDGERLLTQLPYLQEKLLRTNPPAKASAHNELNKIGQQLQVACTSEQLQEAAQALGSWQQRYGFVESPPKRTPSRVETPKQEARVDPQQPDKSGCQAAVRTDCERLLKQLFYLQGKVLDTVSASRLALLKELDRIGQQLRAARTSAQLQEAAQALGSWQQRRLPQ